MKQSDKSSSLKAYSCTHFDSPVCSIFPFYMVFVAPRLTSALTPCPCDISITRQKIALSLFKCFNSNHYTHYGSTFRSFKIMISQHMLLFIYLHSYNYTALVLLRAAMLHSFFVFPLICPIFPFSLVFVAFTYIRSIAPYSCDINVMGQSFALYVIERFVLKPLYPLWHYFQVL